jgi:V/A-type H+-transporting ATPase subunit E
MVYFQETERSFMEAQLQELINKIQDEGVKEAERKAAAIVKEAEAKAEALLSQAKKEAAQTIADAQRRAEQAETRGREALKQAARDLVLKLRETIQKLFDNLLKHDIKTALEGNLLEELALKVISAWTPGEDHPLELKLPAESTDRLKNHLAAMLAQELKKGIVITPVDSIDAGFRIGEKNGTMEFDLTDAGLAEILAVFVNPLLAGLITEALPASAPAKGK